MHNVIESATFVGILRVRSDYHVACGPWGTLRAIGFGHLDGAAAELIAESVHNLELTPRPDTPQAYSESTEQLCRPSDLAALCPNAVSLARAAAIGCTDKVRDFLARDGIDSKDRSESLALQAAIRSGNESMVKLLIDAGAPVNPESVARFEPLTDAGIYRHLEIMKLLLHAGAYVDGIDSSGMTLLVSNGFMDPNVTRILVEAGANVDATDKQFQTALMKATSYGLKQTVKVLIDHHANVNLRDANGRTALMHAAAGPFSDAIPLLLESGADPSIRDDSGKSALDLANAANNLGAVAMLNLATKTSH
jgi:ankyrin repeat protein